jgi:hypothetical protein
VLRPDEAPEASRLARALGRLSGKLLVADLKGPIGGFGRGPAAI